MERPQAVKPSLEKGKQLPYLWRVPLLMRRTRPEIHLGERFLDFSSDSMIRVLRCRRRLKGCLSRMP